MKKINVFTPASPHHEKKRTLVEVIARDYDTKKEKYYTEADVRPVQSVMDDQDLYKKFAKNAASVLTPKKIELALETILSLEELNDVARLMELVRTQEVG